MKLKPILRHFWRNNKRCVGMYIFFFDIVATIILLYLGSYLSAYYNAVLALVWSNVWKQERDICIYERAHVCNKALAKKTLHIECWKFYDIGYKNGYSSAESVIRKEVRESNKIKP